MKTISIKKIEHRINDARNIVAALNTAKAEWHMIDHVGWPSSYPYLPEVKFRIAHTGREVLLHFFVTEQEVRAETEHDNGQVYRDSCCEFFLRPTDGGPYYNIETNCMATMLIEVGMKRGVSREKAPEKILKGVKRWSSLADSGRPLPTGACTWQLALLIPATTFYKEDITDFSNKTMYGNYYKTGDDLKEPHYVSWSPIQTENPDFHTPQFFGRLIFE